MKLLLVGDVHTKLDNLDESRRLIKWITSVALEHKATPVLLGDQYDGMAMVRTEVLEFWCWAYSFMNNALSGNEDFISTISLTGNHDLNSDGSASAMTAHEKQTTVASSFGYVPLENKIAAFGYIRDNEKFIELAQDAYSKGFKTILCHAEFNGAQYDNGFYAPHGIDTEKLPPVTFISGHIHKRQWVKSAKIDILYIGTPRMLTRSDIGEAKEIVLWDTDAGLFTSIPTPKEVCEPFINMTITSEEQLKEIPDSKRVYIDLKGSADFIKKSLKKIPETAKVRTLLEQERQPIEIKESDGISTAFAKYADIQLELKNINHRQRMAVLKIIYDKCPILKGASNG